MSDRQGHKIHPSAPKRPLALSAATTQGLAKIAGKQATDPDLTLGRVLHERYVEAFNALHAMNRTPDPTISPAAHRKKVTAAGEKVQKRLADSLTTTVRHLNDRLEKARKEADDRLGVNSDNPQAAEIRTVFRSLDQKQRNEVFNQALADGDSDMIGAVLNAANPVLLGVTREKQAMWRTKAEQTLLPDLVEFSKAAEETIEAIESAFLAFETEVTSMMGTQDEQAQDQAALTAAKSAEAAFNSLASV